MMPELTVEKLRFIFPKGWRAAKYDDWAFYRKQFLRIHDHIKAVDIVALSTDNTVWLIEVKDYRAHPRTKLQDLAEEIAQKTLYTLAALLPAKLNANDSEEQAFANAALNATQIRIVLHLEQPAKHSKLFPRVVEPADLKSKLKTRLRAVDAHPKVFDSDANMSWDVRRIEPA